MDKVLSVYSIKDAEKWDEIVRSFSKRDVYYLSGYTKAFMLHGDGEPQLIYYEDENVRGINVVMKRDISKDKHFEGKIPSNTYFDLITPYGYGGWIIEGDGDAKELFSYYEAFARENNIISEFVRFHPVLDNAQGSKEAYDVIALGNTVAMDLASEEAIWTNITSKNRNMIRKAEKNGIEIRCGSSKELYETFREIYNGTMDKDNATEYYYFSEAFYDSVREDLPGNSQVLYAVNDEEKIIAASIMLYENERMNYHLSGSLREYQNLAPTNLLLYKAALWGCENGYKTLHLGGGVGSGEDSLFKFKRAFHRGELYRFHIGKKIFMQEEYDKLVKMRENLEESSFFPKYRA